MKKLSLHEIIEFD